MKAALALLFVAGVALAADPYTMADLEVLATQGSFAELLEHANDIRPTGRDAKWTALVSQAAADRIAKADPGSRLSVIEWALERFPVVLKDKKFLAAAKKSTLDGSDACLRGDWGPGQNCLDALTRIVDKVEDPAFAFEAAKLVTRNQNPEFALLLFAKAVTTPAKCGDEAVGRSVLAALGLPANDARVKEAVRLADGPCFPTLRATLQKEAKEGGYFASNACPILKKHKAEPKTGCGG